MDIFDFTQGGSPLLVSMPHSGTFIPSEIKKNMTTEALKLPDTDWHIPQLYNFLQPMNVSIIQGNYSRYVVDLNRPNDNSSLYPGQDVPGICPQNTFHQQQIYQNNQLLDEQQIVQRIKQYWQPYHKKIDAELTRIKQHFGYALLWDAHSIKSRVPRFFSGQLPDLNLGTADNQSCSQKLSAQLLQQALQTQDYTSILNGRFKGGFITRHYGKPEKNIHAVQLELSQMTYMRQEFPFAFDENKANRVRPVIKNLIETVLAFNPLQS